MFTNIWIARRNALNLSRTLMVATFVIAIGGRFAVITADDLDPTFAIVNEYDPFT